MTSHGVYLAIAFTLLTHASCVATPAETAETESRIVDGTLGGPDAVVVIVTRRGALCTGALIANRVVLTAKHCVQGPGEDQPYSASTFTIGVGASTARVTHAVSVRSVRTTPGEWSITSAYDAALFGLDVGLLTLAQDVADVEPLNPRLDSPESEIGQTQRAVGFGETREGDSGIKYEVATEVNWLDADVLYALPAICQGDSGGPLISDTTGEVIGVAAFGGAVCGTGDSGYNRIDTEPIRTMIEDVVAEAGACLDNGAERCDGADNNCDGQIDETCTPIGESCASNEQCVGALCATTADGPICTRACDPLRRDAGCSEGFYCASTGGCDGVCAKGTAGTAAIGESCLFDTDCASLDCVDPGDGRRRCLTPCRGDAGLCLADEACAAVPGACGACVAADIVHGQRALGEPCGANEECGSGVCLQESNLSYCSRACADDSGCEDGFHCRDDLCVRGEAEGVGGSCVTNGDCAQGAACATRGDLQWCTVVCVGADDCPTGFVCTATGTVAVCAPEKGLVGQTCAVADDCISALCESVNGTPTCTRYCGPAAPCGVGFECRRPTRDARPLCMTRPVAPGEGGCALSGPVDRTAHPGAWTLLVLGLIARLSGCRTRRL